MTDYSRVTQKIFAGDLVANEIGVFGSFAAGTPTYTTDPATIQSLSEFTAGWPAAVIGGSNPAIEDVNALDYLWSYQLAYLLQKGVAEWDAGTTYYTDSIVSNGSGLLYRSLQNTNLNNLVTDTTWWAPISLPNHPAAAGYVLSTNTTTGIAWTNSPLAQDFTNTRIGVNITTPQNKIHLNGANATAAYLQITNGTTTGTTSTDGSLIGVDASGNLVINQQEALSVLINVNGAQVGSITSAGLVTLGPSTGLTNPHVIQNSNTGNYILFVSAPAASGVSGLKIKAGLASGAGTASEIPFTVGNSADTVNYFTVFGDGSIDSKNNASVSNFSKSAAGLVTLGASGGTQTHVANGSLSISVGLTVDTTTLVVDATNDRVGVGIATPSAPLHVKSSTGTTPSLTNGTMALFQRDSGSSTSSYLCIISGNIGGNSGINFGDDDSDSDGRIWYQNADQSMAFYTNNVARMTISSAGLLTLSSSNSTGLRLPSGSTTLSRYEEGTFTPAIGAVSGSASVAPTYTSRAGNFVRSGKIVNFTMEFTITNWGTNTYSGQVIIDISSLPLRVSGTRSQIQIAFDKFTLPANYYYLMGFVETISSVSYVTFYKVGSNGSNGVTPLNWSELPTGTTPISFYVSGTYLSASQ